MVTSRSIMRLRAYQEVCLDSRQVIVIADAKIGLLIGQKIKLVIAACLWNNPQVCHSNIDRVLSRARRATDGGRDLDLCPRRA